MGKKRRNQYRPFEEAREYARSLMFKNKEEWSFFAKGEMPERGVKPKDIPARVDKIYKGNGWAGFEDFLGTKRARERKKHFWNLEQARAFARRLKLESQKEWETYVLGERPRLGKIPEEMPPNPEEYYRGRGWLSWADFLNDRYTPVVVKNRDFQEARAIVRKMGLKTIRDWESFRNGERSDLGKCPDDIPVWPPHAYRDKGWVNWNDWLGIHLGKF